MVSDPNHSPRFFASPDFAVKNSPISFLTVHMADALIQILAQIPRQVRATAHAHKLPGLKPISVQGYDLVDTEVVFENGGTAHILTGWALPNSAWSTTVQSARLICSEGLIDLGLDTPGLREIAGDGVLEVNPLFRNFGKEGRVTGYGIESPGNLYRQAWARRTGSMSDADLESALDPARLGFYATLILEGATRSLAAGEKIGGSTLGIAINLKDLVRQEIGEEAALYHLR
jgi:predicted dehydrogenase